METLLQVLKRRDGLTTEQAKASIQRAREDLTIAMEEPEFDIDDFMADEFGLEPDYFMDLV